MSDFPAPDAEALERFATRAFDAFTRGVQTGDGGDFAALCDPSLSFTVPFPLPDWRGEQRGRERLLALFRFEHDDIGMRVIFEQRSVSISAGRVAIEYAVAGRNRVGEYRNHNAIVFDVKDARIVRFREYTGDVDPDAVRAISPD